MQLFLSLSGTEVDFCSFVYDLFIQCRFVRAFLCSVVSTIPAAHSSESVEKEMGHNPALLNDTTIAH